MDLKQYQHDFSFSSNELEILQFWDRINLYKQIMDKNKFKKTFHFMDGPPFVSSDNLHHGHLLVGYGKSSINNFYQMNGYNVLNKIGYDVHGLPIEMQINKMLGINTRVGVTDYGISNYNKKCREVIDSFSGAWTPIFNRMGRWADFSNEYKTMYPEYMESVWWVFKQLYDKNLIYQGYKIMPYSTGCCTPLSNFEANGLDSYKEIDDPSAYVKFKIKNDEAFIIAWTTTPWTLSSNLALCVNPEIDYVKIIDNTTNEFYIVAKDCLDNLYKVSKKTKIETDKPYKIVETFKGLTLVNIEYEPVFDYFAKDRKFIILGDSFVQVGEKGSGSGVVHMAPAFGEDDFHVCIKNNIVSINEIGNYCPVDDSGRYTSVIYDMKGIYVRDANDNICRTLKSKNLLFKKEMYKHSYPFCWRTDTPLIYKAVSSIFVAVTKIKDDLIKNNAKVNWVPSHVGSNRFHQWLENTRDWGVSRSRFFGTPIPMWISDDGLEVVCIGSIDELVQLANLDYRPTDLHRENIDHIKIPSKRGPEFGYLKRIDDVLDCWFESGCVPFAQVHYPFENRYIFDDKDYLADYILEGIDQTRGWFYTLMVISTAILNKPAFKNVICSGLILAQDGKKFSKRLNNFVSPQKIFDIYGSDAFRLYLISSPAIKAESFRFNDDDISKIVKKNIQLLNGHKFFIEHCLKFIKDGYELDINSWKQSENIMDKWIVARTGTLLENINREIKNYSLNKIWVEIHDFIEDLTNWYIKFNRNRLKGKNCDKSEQNTALSTLYFVLINSCKIFAPFMPFFSETLFKNIYVLESNDPNISVHLMNYPNKDDFIKYDEIETQMKNLQLVSGIVRQLRSKTKDCQSAKIPIKKIYIGNKNMEFINNIKRLETYLIEEINCLQVEYIDVDNYINYKIEPDYKIIGQKYKEKASKIYKQLNKVSTDQINDFIINKIIKIELDNIILTDEDINIKITVDNNKLKHLSDNIIADIENNTFIAIDSTQDYYTQSVYISRLFITGIQQSIKKSFIRPWHKIKIYYYTDSDFITECITKYKDQIIKDLMRDIYPYDNTNPLNNIYNDEKVKMYLNVPLSEYGSVKIMITDPFEEL